MDQNLDLDLSSEEELTDFGDELQEAAPAAEPEAEVDAPEAEPEVDAPQDDPEAADRQNANDGLIPRYRYNYAARKRREAEERLAALEAEKASWAQQQQQRPAEPEKPKGPTPEQVEARIATLDQEIEDARLDGEKDKAVKLRQEQRYLEQYLVQETLPKPAAAPDPEATTREVMDSLQTQQVVDYFEGTYEALNPKSRAFEAETAEEVMELFDLFRQKMPRAAALEKAANYVVSSHGLNARKEAPTPGKGQVAKNIAAANAQPPDLGDVGYGSDKAGAQRKLDVMHMSQEEFESLDDKALEALLV